MDQDIHFQHTTAFAAGAATTYFRVPYRCTVRDINAIVQADPGDAETITVTYEAEVGGDSVAIGTLTFGSDIAAGATAAISLNATTGDTVLAEDGFLKFVTSAASAANCDIDIELDPYAR
jgi:hypothetical protein